PTELAWGRPPRYSPRVRRQSQYQLQHCRLGCRSISSDRNRRPFLLGIVPEIAAHRDLAARNRSLSGHRELLVAFPRPHQSTSVFLYHMDMIGLDLIDYMIRCRCFVIHEGCNLANVPEQGCELAARNVARTRRSRSTH